MKVKYEGRSDEVQVAGVVVERGGVAEFDDDVAAGLIESGVWSKSTPVKPAAGDKSKES